MNYFLLFLVQSRQTGRQTEIDAYGPTVQTAQMGSKNGQMRYYIEFDICSASALYEHLCPTMFFVHIKLKIWLLVQFQEESKVIENF